MDGFLKTNLETAKNVIKKDWDMVFCVDGPEGSGKSTLAIQCACFCDETMHLDRIVFTPNDFRHAIINAKPYQAVVYDEAYTGLNSRSAMSQVNKTLVAMLAEIRQKNLFVFIVMPTFFDLDKYAAIWRSRALIHVYTGDNFERGYFSFYNVDRKKELYILGKKFYSYAQPRPNFIGRFTAAFPLDHEAYKRKKRNSLTARERQLEAVEEQQRLEALLFERLMTTETQITDRAKWEIMRVSKATFYRRKNEWEQSKDTV